MHCSPFFSIMIPNHTEQNLLNDYPCLDIHCKYFRLCRVRIRPDGAYLVFGREDAGLPEALLAANQEHCIRMPMRDTCRSLNLSNSVAVGVYEVLRQWDFPELLDHGHLRDYEWK